MPRPRPRPHIFDQLKFVTNYMLAGCGPEQDLIFEMNTDAALNLMVLLVGIDAQDIVQGFFDPKRKRSATPRRHGRKRPKGPGFPDLSTEIGRRVSVPEIGEGLKKMPLGRWVLPGINIAEGIAISAAVIEGVTDVAYDNLAGLLDLNSDYCREFSRFRRRVCYGDECPATGYNGPPIVGFPGPTNDPILFRLLLGNVGFITAPLVASSLTERWAISAEVVVQGYTGVPTSDGRLVVYTDRRGVIEARPFMSLEYGDTRSITVDAVIEPGESASIAWNASRGYVRVLSGLVMGYGQKDWLDWLPRSISW